MTPRPKVLTAQIVVRLTPELLQSVEQDALAHERTVAQTIRLAVERYLANAGTFIAFH